VTGSASFKINSLASPCGSKMSRADCTGGIEASSKTDALSRIPTTSGRGDEALWLKSEQESRDTNLRCVLAVVRDFELSLN
jgi:hypothetical protein